MASTHDEVLLFHYEESIYSHRVLWYLHLRGIKYSECTQPPWMPRPDITEGLGIGYRRIPILAIGRDVYCDTRIIFDGLEKKFPDSTLGAKTPAGKGTQKLLEHLSINGGVFWRAASLLPTWRSAFLKDPRFQKDRAELAGRKFDTETLSKGRPEGLAHICEVFDIMETTFLADGRKWILGDDEGLSLADIDAVFPLQWLVRDPLMEGAVPEEYINTAKFPLTFAWIDRFLAAAKAAAVSAPAATTLSGADAIATILQAPPGAFDTQAAPNDPLGLRIGDPVTVSAADLPNNTIDHGVLVTLTPHEICIVNNKRIRVHFPRWNFRIAAQQPDAEAPAPAAPDMRLIYHPRSPFSRKVYMVARELGLADRIALEQVVVAPVEIKGWSDNVAEVAQANPLAKIPTLVTAGGDGIFDSRVIAAYLQAQAAVAPKLPDDLAVRWRLETLQACADGIMDAQVLMVYEDRIRTPEGLRFEKWVLGQTEKMIRGLDWLEVEAGRGTLEVLEADQVASVPEVTVACALWFMDIVKREWRGKRPKLAEWFKSWETRESFVKTDPTIDWKTGDAAPVFVMPGNDPNASK